MHFRRGFPSAGGHRRVRDLLDDSFAAVDERFAEGRKLLHLLHREGEPSLQIRIEICLLIEIDRDMQKRAGWCNLNIVRAALATTGSRRSSSAGRFARQMLRPSMTPSDRTNPWEPSPARCQVAPVRGRDRCEDPRQEAKAPYEIVTEAAEIGRQHDLQLRQRVSEGRVGLAKRVPSRIIEIEHEAGLVELNPLGAISGKPTQHIDIDGNQFTEQR